MAEVFIIRSLCKKDFITGKLLEGEVFGSRQFFKKKFLGLGVEGKML